LVSNQDVTNARLGQDLCLSQLGAGDANRACRQLHLSQDRRLVRLEMGPQPGGQRHEKGSHML
jgi:hypothetical protein